MIATLEQSISTADTYADLTLGAVPWTQLTNEQRSRWARQVELDADAHIEMHPDFIQSWSDDSRDRTIACFGPSNHGGFDSLTAVTPKQVRVPLFPGLKWQPSLNAIRLIGGQVLGAGTTTNIGRSMEDVLSLLNGDAGGFDALLIEDLDTESALFDVVSGSHWAAHTSLCYRQAEQDRWRMIVPEAMEDFWARFSSKSRYNLRRSVKRLEHDFKMISHEQEIDEFVEQAASVSQRSWQGKRLGQRVANTPEFRNQLRHLARLGALRCYLLTVDGDPAAFAIGSLWNGRYRLEEIGYATEYAASSPGTVLNIRLIEDLIESGEARELDFGFGDGDYKRMFGDSCRQSASVLLVSRRLRPSTISNLGEAATRMSDLARKALSDTSLGSKVRQLYRR